MYFEIKNEKIYATADYKFSDNSIYADISYGDYNENPEKYIYNGETICINPEYGKKVLEDREKMFLNTFFEVSSFGFFRKKPKGYGTAIESLNTAFNIVSITGVLPENTLTFYKKPDFANEEECSEEWLTENSYKNKTMTAQEFGEFYANFVTAWNNEEHK